MRKITALVFALAVILSFAGCSSDTMTLNIGKASRLELISGVTGRTVELNDAGSIKRISDNINSSNLRAPASLIPTAGHVR